MRYPVLIEREPGTVGVIFPDLPGCVAAAETIDQALVDAADVLRDWIEVAEEDGRHVPPPSALEDIDVPPGCALSSVLLVRTEPQRPSVRINLAVDAGVADALTSEARRRGLTRKAYLEWLMRYAAGVGL